MATRRDRRGDAIRNARAIRTAIASELLNGRRLAGLSQAAACGAVGISRSQLGRIERAEIANVTVDQLSRACAAVALRLVARAYPDGDPVRDAAHVALLRRLQVFIPSNRRWRTEVPMSSEGDLRAWDAVIDCPEGPVGVEAETRLGDLQAV